jgi:hypothetical protein
MRRIFLFNQWRVFSVLVFIGLFLSGCSAIHTSVAKNTLDVQTKMTHSIFLDPMPKAKRIVYVEIRNTTDKPDLSIEPAVKQALMARGFELTDDPEKAYYWLQANILQVGRDTKKQRGSDGNSAIVGGAVGSTLGDGDGRTALAITGALLATMIDASVADVYYKMITDIRISQRDDNVVVRESEHASLSQGTSGKKMITVNDKSHWRRYQTQIVSVANKANLTFDEAKPALIQGLSQSLSQIF